MDQAPPRAGNQTWQCYPHGTAFVGIKDAKVKEGIMNSSVVSESHQEQTTCGLTIPM